MTQSPQSPSPAWPSLPLDATFYHCLMDEMAGLDLHVDIHQRPSEFWMAPFIAYGLIPWLFE